MTVTVVGLGKLGAPLLAVIADKQGGAIGVDTNPEILQKLQEYRAPVEETGLQSTLDSIDSLEFSSGVKRLSVTSELGNAVLESDIVFIVVPTPSQEDGQFSSENVREVAVGIGKALRNTLETQDERYRLFVLVSTVMPGQTQVDFLEVIEETSGVSYGKTWGVCYSPEFIALGSVIHDILNPDFVLIGLPDRKAADTLELFYRKLCDNDPPFRLMNLVNAEIAKLALNCYVTTKITYANMLAELCEKIPGAHVDEVTDAIGMDSRIGPKFLTGATPYGGPCFPRDNLALQELIREADIYADLIEATHHANNHQIDRLLRLVFGTDGVRELVAVIGTAYKLGTSEKTESVGWKIVGEVERNYGGYSRHTNQKEEAQQIVDDCGIVVITLPFEWTKGLDYRGKTVIDCWRILNNPVCKKYIPIGVGPEPEELT